MDESYMQKSRVEVGQKVDLCIWKTKIYRTIEGLIILFIKLQFSIRCNQAFRSLRTSTSNIYLNLSLNSQRPTGLVTCIILMHLYHPDIPHDSRRAPIEVFAFDQIRSRPMYLSGLGTTSLLPKKPLSFLLATLTFLKTKLTFA